MIAAILWAAARAGSPRQRYLSARFVFLLLVLNLSVFISDLTHGNINLVIGGLIALSVAASYDRRDWLAGLAVGLATVLKITPLLFLPYFVYKRRWRAVAGAGLGIVLFAWLIPGLCLGFESNHELLVGWYRQMVAPFLSGENVTYMQTQHINQSLTGLFYRLFSDTTAIAADAGRGYAEVRVNLLALDPAMTGLLLKAAFLALVGGIAWFGRTPPRDRQNPGHLGEAALVFLAMLMISERSWKHHYVLVILAHGFIVQYLYLVRPSGWRRFVPLGALVFAVVCHNFFASGFIGYHWSNVAEAIGVYAWGALALFAGCAVGLDTLRRNGWQLDPPPDGSLEAGTEG
jgi:hypothetical protein